LKLLSIDAMQNVTLNKCLNKEAKLYGLSYFGVIGGGILGILIWLKFSMTFGLLSTTLGYGMSAYMGKNLHNGLLQRFVYKHLPIKKMFGGRYLPESYKKCWF
jgi:hypothetical protein